MKVLSNYDIDRYYGRFRTPQYGGTYPKNSLHFISNPNNKFFIINLEDMGMNGSHWVLMSFLDHNIGYFFDSYGVQPPQEVLQFMKKHRLVNIMNESQYQHKNSMMCGYFTVYIANNLMDGRKFSDILNDFDPRDLDQNDKMLQKYFSVHKKR